MALRAASKPLQDRLKDRDAEASQFQDKLTAWGEQAVQDNPDDFFGAKETERRMSEVMARLCGRPRAVNMKTGQNLQPPFLSESELKARGYPCDPGFE